jgi:hypothetical protein
MPYTPTAKEPTEMEVAVFKTNFDKTAPELI